MPTFIKHTGQVNSNGRKCVVVFRKLPGDNDHCLVVETEALSQLYHDTLIEAVESPAGQAEADFFNFAQRSVFHDGVNMLQGLHQNGWLRKLPTVDVTMMPTPDIKINLSELNTQLDSLENVGKTTSSSINEPASVQNTEPANAPGTLSDQQIANQMRSQASFFKREAERLYAEAETLDPQTTAATKQTATEAPRQKRAYNRKK